MKDLADCMDSPKRGAISLIGADADIWRKPDMDDLVALDAPLQDAFTDWVANHLLDWYHKALGRRIHVSCSSIILLYRHLADSEEGAARRLREGFKTAKHSHLQG